jgi:hypothetical protein
MNCKRCGGVVVPSASFCEDCGAPVGARQEASGDTRTVDVAMPVPVEVRAASATQFASAAGEAAATAGPAVAAGPAVLPGTQIRLGDGEVVWRRYQAVRLRSRRRGQGTLYVTDARVVFYAWTKGTGKRLGSELIQQVKLEDISGFSAYVSRRVSIVLMLLAAAFSVATLVTLLTLLIPLVVLFLILAVVCIAALFTDAAQRGSAGVIIQSREAAASAVAFGGFGARNSLQDAFVSVALFFIFPPLLLFRLILRSYTAFDVTRGRPGDDSGAIIAELGALVMDLQTRGTFAGEHWGVQQGEDQLQVRGVG